MSELSKSFLKNHSALTSSLYFSAFQCWVSPVTIYVVFRVWRVVILAKKWIILRDCKSSWQLLKAVPNPLWCCHLTLDRAAKRCSVLIKTQWTNSDRSHSLSSFSSNWRQYCLISTLIAAVRHVEVFPLFPNKCGLTFSLVILLKASFIQCQTSHSRNDNSKPCSTCRFSSAKCCFCNSQHEFLEIFQNLFWC